MFADFIPCFLIGPTRYRNRLIIEIFSRDLIPDPNFQHKILPIQNINPYVVLMRATNSPWNKVNPYEHAGTGKKNIRFFFFGQLCKGGNIEKC